MKLKTATLSLLAGAASLSPVAAESPVKKPAPKLIPKPTCELPIKKVDPKALFKIADANKDGVVTFEEFSKAYAKLEKEIAATIPKPAPVPPTPPIGIPEPCLGCGLG